MASVEVLGQMQLAAAGLDPTLDRFTVAGHFCLRQLGAHVRALGRPRAAVLVRGTSA